MIHLKILSITELGQLAQIDVSEQVTLSYRWINGKLESFERDSARPVWSVEEWAQHVSEWQRDLQPDLWLGAFDGERLAGVASLRYRLSEAPSGTMAQLTTLHIDRNDRREGVASQLLAEVKRLVQESGATSLYVSAVESQSAVGFYLSQGFQPTNEPHPALFALEPEDIHMICSFHGLRGMQIGRSASRGVDSSKLKISGTRRRASTRSFHAERGTRYSGEA